MMAVCTPTMMPSYCARITCARRRANGPVIHCESPLRVAILPSSDVASFSVISGRFSSVPTSDETQQFHDVPVDRLIEITEGETTFHEPPLEHIPFTPLHTKKSAVTLR